MTLVTNITPEQTVTYGRLEVCFYDNPREYTTAEGVIKEDRLYISVNIANGKDHVKRKAEENETEKYKQAYDKYLNAKKKGGTLDTVTLQSIEIEELKKQLSAKQAKAKEVKKEVE